MFYNINCIATCKLLGPFKNFLFHFSRINRRSIFAISLSTDTIRKTPELKEIKYLRTVDQPTETFQTFSKKHSKFFFCVFGFSAENFSITHSKQNFVLVCFSTKSEYWSHLKFFCLYSFWSVQEKFTSLVIPAVQERA